MSLQAKTLLNLIAGAVAGLLAWALTDLTGWFPFLQSQHVLYATDPRLLLYGAIFGLLLGLMLGVVETLSLDSQRQMWMALLLGSVIGVFGGAFGAYWGQTAYAILAPRGLDTGEGSPILFFQRLFARAVGYAVIGAIVGAAQGASRRSWVIARQGAFGGLVGGLLGGAVFQVAVALLNTSVIARLAALTATGALIGFFVGLVQNLFKQAWVRVVLGRNEGKEYLLARPITTIGRSELSDIGLYGDPAIAPTHAVIEAIPAQKRHRLRHVAEAAGPRQGGLYPPTLVNGQPVTAEQWLADGDTVQIAKRTLLFQEKATRGVTPVPASPASVAPPAGVWPPPLADPAAPTRYVGQELAEPPGLPPEMRDRLIETTTIIPRPGGGRGTRLTCTDGPYAGQSFPLTRAPATLGRAVDCNIALIADAQVSRRQAEISYVGGQHQVRDLDSSNGTVVNGQRLAAPHPLAAGDVIQFGDTVLRYE